jgi:hypothetical protein
LWNFYNEKIYNGKVIQGKQNSAYASPINLYHDGQGSENVPEIAGVTVVWTADDANGINSGHTTVHHNIIHDKGTWITDRHQGIKAVHSDGSGALLYNSFRRFRHVGVRGDFTEASYNEMYGDSFATNSFALAAADGQKIHGNKIFGMGYMPIGIGWAKNIDVQNNFIYMHGTAPARRSTEYNRNSSISGIRYTIYEDGQEAPVAYFKNNTIILMAHDDCGGASGLWLSNNPRSPDWVFEDNIVKVERVRNTVTSGFYDAFACVDIGGDREYFWGEPVADPLNPIIFRNNTLIGNEMFIVFGTDYGAGGAAWFYNTKMVKTERASENFLPIRMGWWYFSTMNHRLIDTVYTNFEYDETQSPLFFGRSTAAGEEDATHLSGVGAPAHPVIEELRFGFTKRLLFTDAAGQPLANTQITVSPADDYRADKITTDESGYATVDILTVRHMKRFYGHGVPEADTNGDIITTTPLTEYAFAAAGYSPAAVTVTDDWRNKQTETVVLAAA